MSLTSKTASSALSSSQQPKAVGVGQPLPRPRLGDSLTPGEQFWYNHCDWLQAEGYTLRARFQEGWVPSWKGTNKFPLSLEDGVSYIRGNVMDATRSADGAVVMMKWISKKDHPFEVDIGTWLSAEPQRSDPRNHCVPIYAVLETPEDPNIQILVMPFLLQFAKPRFDTFGEAISFFKQIFEGLDYMHQHDIAHRDCMKWNIMMDASPLFSEPYHPVEPTMKRDFSGTVPHRTRTQSPVKYYLTDFGISRRYKPEERPPLEPPILGGDKSVPEFVRPSPSEPPNPCDPFPTDVYYLGNLIKEEFITGTQSTRRKLGFEFMEPLVKKMTLDNPKERPTTDQVIEEFDQLVRKLSSWKLRSRVAKEGELHIYHSVPHWLRRLRFVWGRVPAIPMP
ncbi:hypothetical protein C8J57DRAFT_1296008 [Mycena rebaudengoi]|nr:hypothetical protein C8J57DRAFT_1296008 [Mycena rebaudengoi]